MRAPVTPPVTPPAGLPLRQSLLDITIKPARSLRDSRANAFPRRRQPHPRRGVVLKAARAQPPPHSPLRARIGGGLAPRPSRIERRLASGQPHPTRRVVPGAGSGEGVDSICKCTVAGGWLNPPRRPALVCGAHLSPPEASLPTLGAVTGMASLRSLPGGSQKPLFGSYLGSTQARDASTHGPSAQAQGWCEGRVGARAMSAGVRASPLAPQPREPARTEAANLRRLAQWWSPGTRRQPEAAHRVELEPARAQPAEGGRLPARLRVQQRI